jgi:hypothetical protein
MGMANVQGTAVVGRWRMVRGKVQIHYTAFLAMDGLGRARDLIDHGLV